MTPETPQADNSAVQSYGALLFRSDPSRESAAIMERVCTLSEADYDKYNAAYNVMWDVLMANMFAYVRQSALDLMRTALEASEAMRDGKISPTRPDDVIEWGVRLRSAVLSLCSSIHHHQDQSYISVKRKFGEDSPEHQAMKVAFAEIYDDCFGYRYLYKLRNVMVHYTMLAVKMKGTAQEYQGEPVGVVELHMDRSALLENKRFVNSQLRTELNELEDDPSIYDMAKQALPNLQDTNRKILAILYPEIDQVCEIVREFDAIFEGRPGMRAIIHQQSPELRPPFNTGFTAWAAPVFEFAYSRIQSSTPPTSGRTAGPHSTQPEPPSAGSSG